MPEAKTIQNKRLRISLIPPFIFLAILWLIYIFNLFFDLHIEKLGIYPRTIKGLIGIITSPFIHINIDHILSNSIPIFILIWTLLYFYRDLSYKIIFLSCIINNTSIWLLAEQAWHIGISGLIYSLVTFIFFSGLLRDYIKLIAISFVVIFLYGGLFWGIFPTDRSISWESHLFGAATGIILAIMYRKQGPRKTERIWIDDEQIPEDVWNSVDQNNIDETQENK